MAEPCAAERVNDAYLFDQTVEIDHSRGGMEISREFGVEFVDGRNELGKLSDPEYRVKMNRTALLELRLHKIVRARAESADAGVVEPDVDLPELGDRPLRECADLVLAHLLEDETQAPDRAKVAWRSDAGGGITLQLYRFTWENPRPDIPIQTLDFTSKETDAE